MTGDRHETLLAPVVTALDRLIAASEPDGPRGNDLLRRAGVKVNLLNNARCQEPMAQLIHASPSL